MPWRDGVHFDTSSKARIGGAILYSSLPTGSWSGHPIRSFMTLHHTADMPHARTRYKTSVFIITTFIANFKIYFDHSPFNISARAGRGTAV